MNNANQNARASSVRLKTALMLFIVLATITAIVEFHPMPLSRGLGLLAETFTKTINALFYDWLGEKSVVIVLSAMTIILPTLIVTGVIKLKPRI